jgi:hypothetical protein
MSDGYLTRQIGCMTKNYDIRSLKTDNNEKQRNYKKRNIQDR